MADAQRHGRLKTLSQLPEYFPCPPTPLRRTTTPMPSTTPTTTAVTSPPDPPKDPPATTLPENIDALLHVARILLSYGRHLAETIRQRAAAPGFSAIAANFGTANVTTILAHLN